MVKRAGSCGFDLIALSKRKSIHSSVRDCDILYGNVFYAYVKPIPKYINFVSRIGLKPMNLFPRASMVFHFYDYKWFSPIRAFRNNKTVLQTFFGQRPHFFHASYGFAASIRMDLVCQS
jgi:hypothetical protein